MGLAKRSATNIRPKAVQGGIFGRFFKTFIYRTEVAVDALTGVAVEQVGMDVCGKFCDSRLNGGRLIRLLCSM